MFVTQCVVSRSATRVLKPGCEFILGLYHTLSFFHADTLLVDGIVRGRFNAWDIVA